MSLTSFLARPDVRKKFLDSFSTPNILHPACNPVSTLTAGNPSLAGTAFDYLLRFELSRRFGDKVYKRELVAYSALEFFDQHLSGAGTRWTKEFELRFKKYKSDQTNIFELAESCLKLATMDNFVRSSYLSDWPSEQSDSYIKDMVKLLEHVPFEKFEPKKRLLLNPVFGAASNAIGGADADLLIDETLIDIKTTKDTKRVKEYAMQLFGYWLLSRLNAEVDSKQPAISQLGFYFSRFGHFVTFNPMECVDESKLAEITNWMRVELKLEGRLPVRVSARKIRSKVKKKNPKSKKSKISRTKVRRPTARSKKKRKS